MPELYPRLHKRKSQDKIWLQKGFFSNGHISELTFFYVATHDQGMLTNVVWNIELEKHF